MTDSREDINNNIADSMRDDDDFSQYAAQHEGRGNFVGKNGKFYLVRCYVCGGEHGRENWAPAVASGTCAWCGWGA